MFDAYYSNGRAAVAGYDEAYSAGSDDYFAEDAGAEAARRHNEAEGHWAALEAEEDYLKEQEAANGCANCGDLGYTIEINDEGVEYMEGCFDCFVAAHEAEAA